MENLAIEIIKTCKNINNLPSTSELQEKIEEIMDKYDSQGIEYEKFNDAYDCIFNAFTNNKGKIVLLDDTEIILTDLGNECIECKDSNLFKLYYYIPEIDIYICLECGIWLKYHADLFNEICNEYGDTFGYEEKLLPLSWDDNGVKAYFRSGIEYLKAKEDEEFGKMQNMIDMEFDNNEHYDEYIHEADCCSCIHMKKCEYCNEEFCDEGCNDWESR